MNFEDIKQGIIQLIKKAETELPDDVIIALKNALEIEEGVAKTQIESILKNVNLAKKTQRPMCQDTGIQTFFVKAGLDFPYIDHLKDLITNAVKRGTQEIPLRPNTVDPFTGKNHKDNTGDHIPYITWDFTTGSDVLIISLPKGGGSENMSKLGMLKPGVGLDGVKDFVVNEMKKAGGGVIINIGSMAGVRPRTHFLAYASAKGAVNTLTKALALEIAPNNIRVNCINPGPTDTPLWERVSEDFKKASISTIPLGRVAKAEDVAYAALYLASDESSMLTGTSIDVDGGRGI